MSDYLSIQALQGYQSSIPPVSNPEVQGGGSGEINIWQGGQTAAGPKTQAPTEMASFNSSVNVAGWGQSYNERGLALHSGDEIKGNKLNIFA